jgi:hypothetical protein
MNMEKRLEVSFITITILVVLFSGCSTGKSESDINSTADQIRLAVSDDGKIAIVPCQTLNQFNGSLNITPIVEVRMANESERSSVPGLWEGKEVAGFSALGLGSLGLGLVAPPLYASGLVVGGIFLVLMPSSMGAIEGVQRNTIKEVLLTTDFSALTQQAIIESMCDNELESNNEYILSIIILAYGFTEKISDEICFSVDAEIKLKFQEIEIFKDYIYIEPFLRSEDAPPPQCASVDEFANNEGELVKQTIDDFSIYLASIVAHRLPCISWKKY